MRAYKGFAPDLTSRFGNGKKECCTFEMGKTYREKECKTMRNGFHCYENPFQCLGYYPMDGKNKLVLVEAGGDINEDAEGKIACTELTLIEELTPVRLAMEGMRYIILHPDRSGWQQDHRNVVVQQEEARGPEANSVAIARGQQPVVSGASGSILGIILETEPGKIIAAKLFVAGPEQAGKKYTLKPDRTLQEVTA